MIEQKYPAQYKTIPIFNKNDQKSSDAKIRPRLTGNRLSWNGLLVGLWAKMGSWLALVAIEAGRVFVFGVRG